MAKHEFETYMTIIIGDSIEREFVLEVSGNRYAGYRGSQTEPPEAEGFEIDKIKVRECGKDGKPTGEYLTPPEWLFNAEVEEMLAIRALEDYRDYSDDQRANYN